jgi:hypothetical protein
VNDVEMKEGEIPSKSPNKLGQAKAVGESSMNSDLNAILNKKKGVSGDVKHGSG